MNSKFLTRASTTRVEALIKGPEQYTWYRYFGVNTSISDIRGKEIVLEDEEIFGLRSSRDGKLARMILARLGPTKVFTLDFHTDAEMREASEPYFEPKLLVKPNIKVAKTILMAMGFRKNYLTDFEASKEGSENRLMFRFPDTFPFSAKTCVNIIVEFYKRQGLYKKIIRDSESYTIHTSIGPKARIAVYINDSDDLNDAPSSITFLG
jgi:hypothetical protein